MSRIKWRVAFAVAVLAAALGADSRPAAAHEYYTDGNVPNPAVSGIHNLYVNVGSTITLTVKNAPGQTCMADITATGFGTQISLTSPQPAGSIATRDFKITGKAPGETSFDVAVQGVTPCTENSHNPFDVVVLPAEAPFTHDLLLASKSESKGLATALTMEYATLRTTTTGILNDLAAGKTQPGPAAQAVADAWYGAWANGYFHGRQTLTNLDNFGSSQLLTGQWPECTGPLGFGSGSRGAFDSLRFDVRNRLEGYRLKLDKQIALDTTAFRKISSKYDVGFSLSYDLRQYPDVDVSGPTRSAAPADPPAPLWIGYSGAVSYTTPTEALTCVGFAGIANPSLGALTVRLLDGTGVVGVKTTLPDTKGTWDVMFDNLKAGKTYRAVTQYGTAGAAADTTKIFAPMVRYNF
jgi:hypothetical protein